MRPRPLDPAAPPAGAAAPGRSGALRPLAVLLGLAVVTTAHAPGAITVRRGDTLSELAQRHGTSVAALRSANGLSGSQIRAGQTLQLTGGRAGSSGGSSSAGGSSSGQRVHVVRSGENVSGIARRYGASVSRVLRANRLGSRALIHPGQRLVVPGRTASGGQRSGAVAPGRDTVRSIVASTARRHGVSPSLALAVAYQESSFRQGVVSSAGAIGVMQVMPHVGRNLSRQIGRPLDLYDTRDNVTAGVLLLRQLLRTQGPEARALAAYYQGIGSLARRGMLPSTRAYIRNVLALRTRFA